MFINLFSRKSITNVLVSYESLTKAIVEDVKKFYPSDALSYTEKRSLEDLIGGSVSCLMAISTTLALDVDRINRVITINAQKLVVEDEQNLKEERGQNNENT